MLCPSSLWPGVGQKRQWQDRLGWFPCRGLALSFVPGGCGDWIIEMWEKHGEAITALRWPSESTTRSLVQVSGCHWFLSRKSMQIFHLLHFVALLYIYIYYFCRGFRLSKPLLQITALKAQSVSLISTGHLLRWTDHSILAYSILLSFYCHSARCIKTSVNLRRGMLARSRGGKFNGHLLRAHPERSVLLSIPL